MDLDFWRRWWRRLSARAVDRAMAVVGATPRLRGLALRALLDRQLAPGVLCRVPFEDHTLYVDPRDDKIALKLLAGRPWQRRELETAVTILREEGRLHPDGLFLDIGANIGAHTVYAMRSGAFAHTIALEPDPHNVAILQHNLAINGLDDRVRVIAAAASAFSGRLQLMRHGKNHGAHSVEAAFVAKPVGSIDVTAVSLDDLMLQQGIAGSQVSLVKIDVEGHELAVLEGMLDLRRAGVPLLVEFTADRGQSGRVEAFKGLLLPYYSHVLDLSDSWSRPRPLAVWTSRRLQADILVF